VGYTHNALRETISVEYTIELTDPCLDTVITCDTPVTMETSIR
jgi:hypothetical protein